MAKKKKTETEESVFDFSKMILSSIKSAGIHYDYMEQRREDFLSTGSLALDLIIGGGIIPGSRFTMQGKEKGGKSALTYSIFSAAVGDGTYTLFYDYEGTTDPNRLKKQRYPVDIIKQDSSKYCYTKDLTVGEQAFDTVHDILTKVPRTKQGKAPILFITDSLTTMLPTAMLNGTNQMNREAAMFSQKFKSVKSSLAAKRCIWVDTNQIRQKPGVAYGNPEYSPGGEAIKHYADYRVNISPIAPPSTVKQKEGRMEIEKSITGGVDRYTYSKFLVDKSKSCISYRQCLLRIWGSNDGKSLGIIDPFYDVYEFLNLSNQISIESVRGKGRVVTLTFKGIEKFKTDLLYGSFISEGNFLTLRWLDFKAFVLKNLDVIIDCLKDSIIDGSAITLFEANDAPGEGGDDDEEDEEVSTEILEEEEEEYDA